MRFALAAAALIMNALDDLTTLRCLSTPGLGVYEANPMAAWAFGSLGLRTGLLLDVLLSALAVAFLVYSNMFSFRLRMAILLAMALLPAWAAVNNWQVLQAIGLPLLG